MSCKINSVQISGLYGIRDYLVKFSDNKLIIIGENGSGKTTLSRIIYATLSCNWDLLRTYPFDKIIINFEDEAIQIEKNMINEIFTVPDIERFEYFVDRRSYRRNFDGLISVILDVKKKCENNDFLEEKMIDKHPRFHIPYEYISGLIKNKHVVNLYNITCKIQNKFKSKILYLPTYRRIEEQLKNILPDLDKEISEKTKKRLSTARVLELAEFGMDDVVRLVDKEQDNLKLFSQTRQNKLTLGYLSEIVSRSYESSSSYIEISQLSEDEILEVLKRIDSSILSDKMKAEVLNILNLVRSEKKEDYPAHIKIVCHYFMRLMDFNQEITKAELHIRNFQEKCNKYLINNKIEYNSQDFNCKLINIIENKFDTNNKIEFQNLSSGEKQIVSIFSHLYLDKNSSIFVFIDEPELSLSVEWQRTFLTDIVDSPNCIGLVATTHSPFIFDNELEETVHGINEFCIRG